MLKELNDGKLKEMGVHKSVREIFLDHPKFSPTQTTFLVGALNLMTGVADREIFIQMASLVQNEAMAFWRRRQAEMMAAYHLKVGPVARVTRLAQTSVLQRKDGRVVGLFPNDHVAWMRTLERLTKVASRSYEKLPNGTGKELWVKGTVSPLARRKLESAGWVVEENVIKKLALDEE